MRAGRDNWAGMVGAVAMAAVSVWGRAVRAVRGPDGGGRYCRGGRGMAEMDGGNECVGTNWK